MGDIQQLELAATYSQHTCIQDNTGAMASCIACAAARSWIEVRELASQAIAEIKEMEQQATQSDAEGAHPPKTLNERS
jgi:hypothetical protein